MISYNTRIFPQQSSCQSSCVFFYNTQQCLTIHAYLLRPTWHWWVDPWRIWEVHAPTLSRAFKVKTSLYLFLCMSLLCKCSYDCRKLLFCWTTHKNCTTTVFVWINNTMHKNKWVWVHWSSNRTLNQYTQPLGCISVAKLIF